MSVEEDVELKDLVAQTLETNGCLARIRAQLRASIFLALDEDVKLSKQQPLLNNKVKTHLETDEGKTMFCIVREFLEFFNLYFTISVFEPESYMGTGYQYEGRQKIAKDLGLDFLEDATVPLLLQLIRIAQVKTKNIEIDLNFNSNESDENKSLSHEPDTSNKKKTESTNSTSNAGIKDNEKTFGGEKVLVEDNSLDVVKLNSTYELSSPTVSLIIPVNDKKKLRDDNIESSLLLNSNKKESKEDDTYEDTSSIAEDNVTHTNLETITVPQITINGLEDIVPLEISINEGDVSQPVVKEGKISEKPKLSPQKSEKIKPKTSLSSLSDLPPLQMNKPRVNDILPSLYSKEFKDKSNLRELDKLFDMEAEYEEDFMCSGDDLSVKSDYLKSDHSKINLLEDLQLTNKAPGSEKGTVLNKRDLKQNKSNRLISDCNKPIFKPFTASPRGRDVKSSEIGKSENDSSNSSVSEHLEITSSD